MAAREFCPPIYVYEIPVDVMSQLSKTLDVDNGWTKLAAALGYNSDEVKHFDLEILRHHRSPTESMLHDWGTQNRTIQELYIKLNSVNRIREKRLLEPLLLGQRGQRRRSSGGSDITSVSRQTSYGSQQSYGNYQSPIQRQQSSSSQSSGSNFNPSYGNQSPSSNQSYGSQQPPRQSSRASSVVTNLDAGQQASSGVSDSPYNNRLNAFPGASNVNAQNHDNPNIPGNFHYNQPYPTPDNAQNNRPFNNQNSVYPPQNYHQFPLHNTNTQKTVNYAGNTPTNQNAGNKPTNQMHDTAEMSRLQTQNMNDTISMYTRANRNRNRKPQNPPNQSKPKLVGVTHSKYDNVPSQSLVTPDPITPDPITSDPITSDPDITPDPDIKVAMSATASFTYKDMSCATNGFADECKIGEGAFGDVYVGKLKESLCAIKKLKQGDNMQSDEAQLLQHATEIKALLRFRHENIVQLYGFSVDNGEICLVYQFMENGSLEDRLQCMNDTPPLTWPQRMDISVGAACGLQYLHTVQKQPLVHGDIKSANVLLDHHFEAKLGDFGLAHVANSGSVTGEYTHVTRRDMSERVYGTQAYLPPEFFRPGGTASVKTDCFGFGVILLEVCSGEKAYDERREPDKLLAIYCENIFDDQAECDWPRSLQDVKGGDCASSIVVAMLKLGRQCTGEKPRRPQMKQVLQQLRTIAQELETKMGIQNTRKASQESLRRASQESVRRASQESLRRMSQESLRRGSQESIYSRRGSEFDYVNQMGQPMGSLIPEEEGLTIEGEIPEAIKLQLQYDQINLGKEDGGDGSMDGRIVEGSHGNMTRCGKNVDQELYHGTEDGCGSGDKNINAESDGVPYKIEICSGNFPQEGQDNLTEFSMSSLTHAKVGHGDLEKYSAQKGYDNLPEYSINSLTRAKVNHDDLDKYSAQGTEYSINSITHAKEFYNAEEDAIKRELLECEHMLGLDAPTENTSASISSSNQTFAGNIYERKNPEFSQRNDSPGLYNYQMSELDNTTTDSLDYLASGLSKISVNSSAWTNTNVSDISSQNAGGSLVNPRIDHSTSGSLQNFQSCPSKSQLQQRRRDFFHVYQNAVIDEVDEEDETSADQNLGFGDENLRLDDQNQTDDQNFESDDQNVRSEDKNLRFEGENLESSDRSVLQYDENSGDENYDSELTNDDNNDRADVYDSETSPSNSAVGEIKPNKNADKNHDAKFEVAKFKQYKSEFDGRNTNVNIDTSVKSLETHNLVNVAQNRFHTINNLTEVKNRGAEMQSLPHNFGHRFGGLGVNREPYSMPYGLPINISLSSDDMNDSIGRQISYDSRQSVSNDPIGRQISHDSSISNDPIGRQISHDSSISNDPIGRQTSRDSGQSISHQISEESNDVY